MWLAMGKVFQMEERGKSTFEASYMLGTFGEQEESSGG